ncbi:hypothetical protein THAOC_01255, partial [Thalassiosira oceanica]
QEWASPSHTGGNAGVDAAHTSKKAGEGPVSAVSANDAPPTGPQECVGQEDAKGLGQASKSLRQKLNQGPGEGTEEESSLLRKNLTGRRSVGVQSSQRSQTKGNDRIKSQRSHNLVEVVQKEGGQGQGHKRASIQDTRWKASNLRLDIKDLTEGHDKDAWSTRQENLFNRFKHFNILVDAFRHGFDMHRVVLDAIAVITRYDMELGNALFDV